MKKLLAVPFVAISLASLWFGCWAASEVFPFGHWANFPAYMTSMLVCFGGAYAAIWALVHE